MCEREDVDAVAKPQLEGPRDKGGQGRKDEDEMTKLQALFDSACAAMKELLCFGNQTMLCE